MNTETNEVITGEAVEDCRPGRDFSTVFLRWLESCGLRLDYGRVRKAHPEDSWWLAHSAGVTGPHPFQEVANALLDGAGSVHYVHESAAADDPPPWRTLSYCPLWLHPTFPKWWKAGLRLACAGFIFLVLWGITPFQFRGWLDLALLPVAAGLVLRRFGVKLRPSLTAVNSGAARAWHLSAMLRGFLWRTLCKTAIVLILAAICAAAITKFHLTPQTLLTRGAKIWTAIREMAKPSTSIAEQQVPLQPSQPTDAQPAEAPKEMERGIASAPAGPELDMAVVARTPAQWPKAVALITAQTFPAVLNGKVIGSVELKPGTMVRLLAVRENEITVDYQGGSRNIPVAATDLEKRLQPGSEMTSTRTSASGSIQPPKTTITPSNQKDPPQEQEQIPGLTAQPASAFAAHRQ